MKLFKNNVGRPSNDTLRKRKIFLFSMIVLAVLLVVICTFVGIKLIGGDLNSGLFNLSSSPVSINVEAYNMTSNKVITQNGVSLWKNKNIYLENWRNYNVGFKIKASTTNSNIKSIVVSWNDGGYKSKKTAEANLNDKKNKNKKIVYSYETDLEFKAEGIRYGYITATDNQGKSRTIKVRVSIDKTAPSVVFKTVDKTDVSKTVVQATCNDELSGVHYMYTYNKQTPSSKQLYNSAPVKSYSQKLTFDLSKGTQNIVTKCIDTAHNDTGEKMSSVDSVNSGGNKVTVKFNKNGASGIGTTNLSCYKDKNSNSCTIKMPTITREGGVVLGWNTDAKATEAKLKPNQTINVSADTTFYAITYETYVATFEKNGATSIGATSKKCKVYNKEGSCEIKTPTITRSGGEVIGWNTIKTSNSSLTSIKPNTTLVLIYPNNTYYALTKKVNKLTIKNGSTTVDTLSCTADSSSSNCSVNVFTNKFKKLNFKTYLFTNNNKKYLVEGFKTSSKGNVTYNLFLEKTDLSQAKKLADLKLDGNKTLYVSLVPVSSILTYRNKTVYVQTGFDSLAKTRMGDICKWAPYLCNVEGDVFVWSKDTYNSRWTGSCGVCYDGVPRDVDVIAGDSTSICGNNYDPWMHEMGHAWDYYYKNKMGKRISEQADFQKLYKYYTENNDTQTDLSSLEFFAAMMPTYVYFKNGIDGSKYNFKYTYWKSFVTSKKEAKLKEYMICVFDKYVAISNNNYKMPNSVKTCKFPY